MTALDRTPLNTNYLQPDGFLIQIKKLPTVTFFTQQINVPAFQLPPTFQPNPYINIPIPGDHIVFDDLQFQFKVDEDLKNYIELYNWIQGLGYPDDYSQFKDLKNQPIGSGLYTDISLLITTNIKNPNIEILFRDAFPIALGGFNMMTTDGSITEVTSTATFKFQKYNISVLPQP